MMRLPLPGASYCFCLGSGDWGALYPDHIQTSRGRVELPGEDVLFLVGTLFNGVIYMAGQGHTSGKAWLWNGSAWHDAGVTFGVSPCAFSAVHLAIAVESFGYRLVSLADGVSLGVYSKQIGSQGLRYIDGLTPVTGDATYRKGELFEYTTRGDVEVGQGHESGCWINGHLLEPGDCRFIRFDRENDLLAVAIVKLPEQQAVLHWLHVTDIALLPVQSAPAPVPPVPVPVPPTPEPKPVPVTNQLATVQRIRAKYPTPLGAQHPAFLIEVAQATGAKLLKKDSGTHVTLPTGVNVSQDILMFGDQGIDILGDGEGAATPGWGEKGTIAGEYIDVSGMGGTVPAPKPTPDPPNNTALLGELQAANARIRELEQENAHLEADNAKLQAHPGYDTMMILIAQAEAAFRDAQFGRRKSPMPASIGAHLVYRLMFEGYSLESLVEDARERGKL